MQLRIPSSEPSLSRFLDVQPRHNGKTGNKLLVVAGVIISLSNQKQPVKTIKYLKKPKLKDFVLYFKTGDFLYIIKVIVLVVTVEKNI